MGHPVHPQPVVEQIDGLEQVGSIEVLRTQDLKGTTRDRILVLPPPDDIESHKPDDEPNAVETWIDTFTSCVACEPQSVLRSRSYYKDNPVEHKVSFSQLDIHEFSMTLGDHPSATTGPPVMLDWEAEAEEKVVDLEHYETSRQPRRSRRRLKLTYDERRKILEKEKGFSSQQVNEAWNEALRIREQRNETLQQGPLSMLFDDFSESANRKFRRSFAWTGLVDKSDV